MDKINEYFDEVGKIAASIDHAEIKKIIGGIADVRAANGRLFIIGVGGSAANCSHAVNDFRKLCGVEAYTPVDNVSELTARTNDEGWSSVFSEWLKVSMANDKDAILVFSVGGGNAENNVSTNIIEALKEGKRRRLKIFGVVGRDGGYTSMVGDAVVVVPTVNLSRITPHSESFQAIVWHCMVSHPDLQKHRTKWESIAGK